MKSAKCDDCDYVAKGDADETVVSDLKNHAKDTHQKDVTDDEVKGKITEEEGGTGGDDAGTGGGTGGTDETTPTPSSDQTPGM